MWHVCCFYLFFFSLVQQCNGPNENWKVLIHSTLLDLLIMLKIITVCCCYIILQGFQSAFISNKIGFRNSLGILYGTTVHLQFCETLQNHVSMSFCSRAWPKKLLFCFQKKKKLSHTNRIMKSSRFKLYLKLNINL